MGGGEILFFCISKSAQKPIFSFKNKNHRMFKHIPDVGFCDKLLQLLCDRSHNLQFSERKSDVLDHFLVSNLSKLKALQQSVRSNAKIKCCLNDGQPLTDQSMIVRCPNRQKRHGEYGFYDYVFCSLSCAKTYLETRNNFSPQELVWLTIHAKRDLQVMEDIPSAPAPELLAMYRTDDEGIDIDTYRKFEHSHRITAKIKHLPHLNSQLWEDEEQKNAEQPFFELIRDKKRVERQLYQEYVDTNKPIPKAAVLDAQELELLAKEQAQIQQDDDI